MLATIELETYNELKMKSLQRTMQDRLEIIAAEPVVFETKTKFSPDRHILHGVTDAADGNTQVKTLGKYSFAGTLLQGSFVFAEGVTAKGFALQWRTIIPTDEQARIRGFNGYGFSCDMDEGVGSLQLKALRLDDTACRPVQEVELLKMTPDEQKTMYGPLLRNVLSVIPLK
jgi:hypothetical protein